MRIAPKYEKAVCTALPVLFIGGFVALAWLLGTTGGLHFLFRLLGL